MSATRRGRDHPGITELAVVVPARDEEELLARCLRSVGRAQAALRDRHPGLRGSTVVVLDRCLDASVAVAAAHDCTVLEVGFGCVGSARATGVEHGRLTALESDPRRVWVASTDADSEVPEGWLVAHADAAAAGADLAVGPVRPDAADLPHASLLRWERLDGALARHERVHGANLGVRLAAYDQAGGFRPVPEHEDVLLVAALRRAGVPEGASPPVLTSARRSGRSPGGFAGYLRGLPEREIADDVPPAV